MTLVIAVRRSRIPGKGIQHVVFNPVPFALWMTGVGVAGKMLWSLEGNPSDSGMGRSAMAPGVWAPTLLAPALQGSKWLPLLGL